MNIAQRNREASLSWTHKSIEYWREEIAVSPSEFMEPMQYPEGWFVVTDLFGAVAAFSSEEEALRYRLNLINRILND
jgi:hypothetical protein